MKNQSWHGNFVQVLAAATGGIVIMDVVETVQRGRYFVIVRPEGSEYVNVTDLDGGTLANKFFAISFCNKL